jgi:hypothetical protein
MTRADLDDLARLVAVCRSTVDAMPHPADSFERWRHRWGQLADLATQINARLGDSPDGAL